MVFAFKCAGACADKGGALMRSWLRRRKRWPTHVPWAWRFRPARCPCRQADFHHRRGRDGNRHGDAHGEPGKVREKLQTADQITERMMAALLADLQPAAGDRLAIMVNGLGATPPEELYVVFRKAYAVLTGQGISIHRAYVVSTPPRWRWPAPPSRPDASGRRVGRAAGSSGADTLFHAGLSGGGM